MCNVCAGKKSVIARWQNFPSTVCVPRTRFLRFQNAAVAQLDRALVSEAEGCGFDPRRLHLNFFSAWPAACSNTAMRKLKNNGYTVIEVLIVVAIIADLAVMAVPAFVRAREREQNVEFSNDIRVISGTFEQFSAERNRWPIETGPGVIPPGMDPFLGNRMPFNATSVGGVWDWDFNVGGIKAAIAVNLTGVVDDPVRMQKVDQEFDDGVLTTGAFRQASGHKYIYILEM